MFLCNHVEFMWDCWVMLSKGTRIHNKGTLMFFKCDYLWHSGNKPVGLLSGKYFMQSVHL